MRRLKGYREVRKVSAAGLAYYRRLARAFPGDPYYRGWLAGYEYGRATPDEKLDRPEGYVKDVRKEA